MTPNQYRDGKAHILLVEDDSGILDTLRLLLEMEGYRVTPAANGEQALESLEKTLPDLVVTDFAMPYADGGDLMRAIRAEPNMRHLPIVLMSAALPKSADAKDLADYFINKPFRVDQLLEVMEALLRQDS